MHITKRLLPSYAPSSESFFPITRWNISAIYLRSGSVWIVALLHGFYDIVVSIPSFFDVKEIVDVSSEYGDTISNYSWGNLVIGLIEHLKISNTIANSKEKPGLP